MEDRSRGDGRQRQERNARRVVHLLHPPSYAPLFTAECPRTVVAPHRTAAGSRRGSSTVSDRRSRRRHHHHHRRRQAPLPPGAALTPANGLPAETTLRTVARNIRRDRGTEREPIAVAKMATDITITRTVLPSPPPPATSRYRAVGGFRRVRKAAERSWSASSRDEFDYCPTLDDR